MITDRDIYIHLKNGGSLEELHKAFAKNIDKIQKQIDEEIVAKKREQELANKKLKARTAAFNTLKSYFALVNPDVDDNIINSILDTFETVEIKVNGVKGKSNMPGSILFDYFKHI